MNSIKVAVSGTSPLLCSKFTDASSLANGTSATFVGDKPSPKNQCDAKLYYGDGKPVIPQPNLFRCLIDAGQFFKAGKSKITTQKSSLVPAAMSIEEIAIPIESKDGWTVDSRSVVIPSTGGRIMCHRPCFNDWTLTFTLQYDTDMFSEKLVRDIVDAAGKKIGLGDFRPSRKGPYGKFNVTKWEPEIN